MYNITVHSVVKGEEMQEVYSVPEYEVKDGALTLATDIDHDVVIPLYHVTKVDIARDK